MENLCDAWAAFRREPPGETDRSLVRSGSGFRIDARHTLPGVSCECLGHMQAQGLFVEALRIEFSDAWGPEDLSRQQGVKFLYILSGACQWRQGSDAVWLRAGDAFLFDATEPHGFSALMHAPVTCLCIALVPVS